MFYRALRIVAAGADRGGRTDTNSHLGKINGVYYTISLKLGKSLSPYPLVCQGDRGGSDKESPGLCTAWGGGNFLGKFGEELCGLWVSGSLE